MTWTTSGLRSRALLVKCAHHHETTLIISADRITARLSTRTNHSPTANWQHSSQPRSTTSSRSTMSPWSSPSAQASSSVSTTRASSKRLSLVREKNHQVFCSSSLHPNSQVHRHVCRSLGAPEPSRSLEFCTISFSRRIVSRQRQCQRHNSLLAILRPAKVPSISRSRWRSNRWSRHWRFRLAPLAQFALARHTKEPSQCHPAHLRVVLSVRRIPPCRRHCHRGT